MVSPTLKITLIGSGIASVIGVSGITLYLKSSSTTTEIISETRTKSISEFLKTENLQLIKDASDSKWTNKWGDFIDAYPNGTPEGIWNISDWENKKTQKTSAPQEFKDNCNVNGSKKVVNTTVNIYQKVKSYCTKSLSITPKKRSA